MGSILERLPAWATTGVGSLPFADAQVAVAHIWQRYEVPFCPQLPVVDGDMIAEWLGADPRRCGWSPARDRERPHAWESFLTQLDRRPPGHGVVKLQVTGPATLAVALERERGAGLSRRGTAALAAEIATWLAANAAEQVRALRDRGLDALLVVDEPAVRELGTLGLEGIWDPLRAVAPAWGLHLCCRVPWELVGRAEPDLLSFDLTLDDLSEEAVASLRRLTARGGRVAWGAVAAHRREGAAASLERLRVASERSEIAPTRAMLTASCGTGRVSPAREREVAAELRAITARMRRENTEPARSSGLRECG
jgi:hypothetical protein